MPPRRPLTERFWEKVDKNGPLPVHKPHLGRCWMWTRCCDGDGYGKIAKGAPSLPWRVNMASTRSRLGTLYEERLGSIEC